MSTVPLEVLERMVVASVGLTARALADVAPELTFVQWRVLVIADRRGGVPVGQLADGVGSKIAAMSRLVGRLQRRGLVETRRDAADARLVRVSLTAAGKDLRVRVLERRRAGLVSAAERLDLDEEAWRSLSRLADAIDEASRRPSVEDPG